MINIYNFSAFFSIMIVFFNLLAFKKRVLDFSCCIFWIVMSTIVFILSVNVSFLEYLADLMSIDYAPSLLFAFGLIFIFSFIFYITILITTLRKKIIRLTQEIGILKNDLKDLKK